MVRLRRGEAQDRERRGRTPLPQKRRSADFQSAVSPPSIWRALETGQATRLHRAPADYKPALRRFGSGYVTELMFRSAKVRAE
jgi:hypothetical protein